MTGVKKVAEVAEEAGTARPWSRGEEEAAAAAASAPIGQRPQRRHSSSGGVVVREVVTAAVAQSVDVEKTGIAGIADGPKTEQTDRNKKREGGLVVGEGMAPP